MPKTTIEHEPWCVKHANDGDGEICHSIVVDIDEGLAVWGAQEEGKPAFIAIDSGRALGRTDNLDTQFLELQPAQAYLLASIFHDGGSDLIMAIYKVTEAMGVDE